MPGDDCPACGPAAPAGPSAPSRAPRGRRRLPLRGLSGASYRSSWTVTALALLGAVLVTGSVFWVFSRSADEDLTKRGYFDHDVTLPPGKEFGYVLIVALPSSYRFDVQPLDGPAVMAVGRVDDGDTERMSDHDLATVMASAIPVEAGKAGTQTGELTRGRYVWVVANPSKDKPLRVKIKFG